MSEAILISTSDIAELVNERLPVVSTWRNRFKSGPTAFPSPAGGTPARPLFDFESVRDWLTTNRPEKDISAGLLKISVWSAIRSLSGEVDQLDLVYWLHEQLDGRKVELDGVAPSGKEGDDRAPTPFGASTPVEIDTIKSLVETASASDLIDISDFTLARLSAGFGRSGGNIGAVGSNVSKILGKAVLGLRNNATRAPVIYDPACGIGETLIETYKAFESIGGHGTVIGTEIDPRVATLARIRLGLRDIPSVIQTADALSTEQFHDMHPDVIVAEPPFGLDWAGVWGPDDQRSRFGVPPTRSADLTWVVDAASRLEGTAGAAVLTSMDALSSGGAEERVRANLIRFGAVQAVIALPPNLLQYSSMPLALWVLRAPSEGDESRAVTLLDVSNPELVEGGAAKRIEWIRENIAYWLIDLESTDPLQGVKTAVVYLHDFLEEGMDLTPARWTAQPLFSGVLAELWSVSNVLAHQIREFKPAVPDFNDLPTAQHIVTVREMTEFPDSREAKLWTGRGLPNSEAPSDTVTSRHISEGKFPTRGSDAESESGFRTEPGDILFTTMNRVRALVDDEGGHRIGNGVHALRLKQPSRFDPSFVAYCLAARWNERHQKGTTIKRAKPLDLEIALLPLDLQLKWVTAHRDLEAVKSGAREILEWVESVEVAAQNALRFGQGEVTQL